jgi:hypothetical protein
LKKTLAWTAAQCFVALLYLSLPLLPLMAAIVFLRFRFIRNYAGTLRKMRVHLNAMRQGPVQHFFTDVVGRESTVPAEIRGSCIQCGNCCMERRCAFLEQVADDKYQCGIYHSMWRRFSNCGSFPLNQHDIDRYACPSYYTVPQLMTESVTTSPATEWVPVRIVRSRSSATRQ